MFFIEHTVSVNKPDFSVAELVILALIMEQPLPLTDLQLKTRADTPLGLSSFKLIILSFSGTVESYSQ